ncbi:MAG: rod shape-determining protein MreD, partial [Alicyclobacillus sp.]|nr:rod shape-determining protein MreD [Alicyclobacillus sp.]
LGLYAFIYGVLAYFAATAFTQFLHRNVAITFLVTVVCTFLQTWMSFGMTRLFDVTAYSWHVVLSRSLWQMIVNGITLLVLYPWLTKLLRSRPRSRFAVSSEEQA